MSLWTTERLRTATEHARERALFERRSQEVRQELAHRSRLYPVGRVVALPCRAPARVNVPPKDAA